MEHIEAQEHFADCRECQKIFQDKLEAQKKELLEKIEKRKIKDVRSYLEATSKTWEHFEDNEDDNTLYLLGKRIGYNEALEDIKQLFK